MRLRKGAGAVLSMGVLAGLAAAQSVSPKGVTQRIVGELEIRHEQGGIARYDFAPADHVVGGDHLLYTVEIRNTTGRALDQVVVISPIPERVTYVAESAVGPGCDIDFSADGGQSFGRPSELTVKLPAGQSRVATAADYTHIRWKLRYELSGTSTAFARFRAVLK
ncbi:MAG: hypothetical protein U1F35_17115 [Steroidobacteraceae bacterium]